MLTLAWKNLLHEKVRLAVTLVGVVFALVLILVQFGLFLSFLETSANIVEHSGADLWITAPNVPHVNSGTRLPEKFRWKALEVPGVQRVEKFILAWVVWKLPSGAQELVQEVGFSVDSDMGRPWNVVAGSLERVKAENAVIVDELYLDKLGIRDIGDTVEVSGRKAKVVALTHGIRSFTTAPFVFTSFKNALDYAPALVSEHETIFLLVRVQPGVDAGSVQAALRRHLPHVGVYTNDEMRWKTQMYWVFQTGAGITTLLGAVLGLVVGVVVVAQTIYAATVDHLREFGTLKAMGATNVQIYHVILSQAVISAAFGYGFAVAIAKVISDYARNGSVPVLLPPEVAGSAFFLALIMCMAASAVSIRKATRIDPATVFRS